MFVSAPIKIVNVDLSNPYPIQDFEAEEDRLYIFWSGNLAVGQFYTRAGTADLAAVLEAVKAAGAEAGHHPGAENFSAFEGRVSVVICTRDRPQDLARCLASFSGQTRRPDQLLVVDNASGSDETRAVALAAGTDYVREDRPGLDIARNTGALRAEGDLVVYTDDDVVLHPHWLARMAAAFDAPEIWAVTGLVLPAELDTEAQVIFERHWGFGRGFRRRDFGPAFYAQHKRRACPSWDIGAGASMAFRKSVFDRIGLFDERLDVGAAGCSGDSEYWNRILHYGGTCRYEPAAIAFHRHRRDRAGLSRQIRAYMSGHVAALLVQYGNTGEFGNVRRLLTQLPRYYLRQALSRLRHGPRLQTMTLKEEVLGCLDGILFMAKDRFSRRPVSSDRSRTPT